MRSSICWSGAWNRKVDSGAYAPDVQAELEKYRGRSEAYRSKRARRVNSRELDMLYGAQVRYERRLVAVTDDPDAQRSLRRMWIHFGHATNGRGSTTAPNLKPRLPPNTWLSIPAGLSASTCRCSRPIGGCARRKPTTTRKNLTRPRGASASTNWRSPRRAARRHR